MFPMQALKSLVAPHMLGPQLLLQRGVVPGLLSLIRPQHLASLADWEAQWSQAGQLPSSRTVPGLVAAILQDGVLQPQSTMLRDLYQVRHWSPGQHLHKLLRSTNIVACFPFCTRCAGHWENGGVGPYMLHSSCASRPLGGGLATDVKTVVRCLFPTTHSMCLRRSW